MKFPLPLQRLLVLLCMALLLALSWRRFCLLSCSYPPSAPKIRAGEIGCEPVLCNYLQVVICPDSSTTAYCQGIETCSKASCLRRQYVVRLAVTDTMLPDTFYLQYRTLSVSLNFAIADPSTGGLSFIDTAASRGCSSEFYDLAEFDLEAHRITLDLSNSYSDPCTADSSEKKVLFINGFAHLFTVVVNAYPGETVNLTCGDLVYDSNEGGYSTCFEDGASPENAFGCGPVSSLITGATPGFPSGTDGNGVVGLKLESSSQGTLPCEMAIVLENKDTAVSVLQVEQMDFAVHIRLSQVMDSIYPVAGSAISAFDWQLIHLNDTALLLHIQTYNTVYAHSGQESTLFTIHVGTPALGSLASSAEFAFDAGKGRMLTGYGCSKLNLSDSTAVCSADGYPQCTVHDLPVRFTIDAPAQSGLCDDQLQIDIGMFPADAGNISVKFYRLGIELDVEHSAGITVAGITTDQADEWGCAANNNGCDSANAGTCVAYQTDGTHTRVVYCLDVDTLEAYTLFVPDDGVFIRVFFNYPGYGCIQDVRLRRFEVGTIDLNTNLVQPVCVPQLDTITGFPLCPLIDQIVGTIRIADTSTLLDGVAIHSQALDLGYAVCQNDDVSTCPAAPNYALCVCDQYEHYRIVPYKNDDPLNGVSTFDLVLINKHILAVEPLNSPYKMIAADANHSNDITTFDLVWLRKLILGIIVNFDTIHNTSWRFIEAGYQFANSANPFQDTTNWPQTVDVYPNFSNNPVDTVDFTAIKVGDVNGNASTGCSAPNQRPAAKPALPLSLGAPGAAARGEYLTLPLRYDGPEALEAFQLGLRFDPARLELIGPSRGDARGYTASNFNLAQAKNGEIRTLWLADPLDEDNRLLPGQTLFYLTFRVLQSVESEAAALLQTDEGLLGSLAWTTADAEYALALQARPAAAQPRSAEPPAALRVTPQPNPTTGAVTFQIESSLAGKAHFSLFGPFGNRVYYREAALERGPNALSVPETAGLAPGVYIWQVRLGGQKTEGRIVKQ